MRHSRYRYKKINSKNAAEAWQQIAVWIQLILIITQCVLDILTTIKKLVE